ncbi:orotidine 5'-phosphate decarboxylase / HUMPS family protein [Enterococcus timonensis]|uniref:orotidine 5'-phosphate decarboxylase / HUMPS family protein n=1 Tax=Enterococcus timonensis TaxID=1852364 RepID=UPI0008DB1A7D|nr:orotidine 5'-phosphate decarboxylase / HUMPS family protein [Enterococcus timonensis]
MKLQTAIDRVTLEEALMIAKKINGKTDIFEMGTSLIKDYGTIAIEQLREVLTESELLVDMKTIDEGGYEFKQGFRYGGDILTVMGAASLDTLKICYDVTQQSGKTMMIDLLEVDEKKIASLLAFEEAIFCIHHSIDRVDHQDAVKTVAYFHHAFPQIKHLAVAGGIDLETTKSLAAQKIVEIVIVGSSITKADHIEIALDKFIQEVHK